MGRLVLMMADDRRRMIQQIETHARDAWPAAQRDVLHGWQLRFTYGITRRANSVWPNGELDSASLDEVLNEAELFYAIYEMPARFQVSPVVHPSDLDIVLALRGYQRSAATAVQTTSINTLLDETGRRLPESSFKVDVSEKFSEPWFQTYNAIEQFGSRAATVRRDIIQRIRVRTGYALVHHQNANSDEPVAVGLGVLDGSWLGISCMATHEHMRRRGAATIVLNALAGWAQEYGALNVYLQVLLINAAALPLYNRSGFSTLYHYHYREKQL